MEKKCKVCAYFPCLKYTCNIGNKEWCEDFKSIVTKEINKIWSDANEKTT